ncbi:MAG: hypothetical protein DHS20C18_38530 [Saprospiraceae bacterium]|nr:MAG: hypothetical protein DHS20C18_38530 [Saprospiraceae bacterium]
MNPFIFYPGQTQIDQFLQEQAHFPIAYSEVGQSADDFPPNYDHDSNEILLGEGPLVFSAAKAALRKWDMFPYPWTRIYPQKASIEEGKNVAVLIRLFGLWWLNASRIVYTIEQDNHYGFAYGTLPGHFERGEECFSVRQDKDGKVWYQIKAFSRPGHWLIRLGYPVARYFQRRFVRDSMAQMVQATSDETTN